MAEGEFLYFGVEALHGDQRSHLQTVRQLDTRSPRGDIHLYRTHLPTAAGPIRSMRMQQSTQMRYICQVETLFLMQLMQLMQTEAQTL